MSKITKIINIDRALDYVSDFKSQSIECVILKNVEGFNISDSYLKQIVDAYKKFKIEIAALDPNIPSIDEMLDFDEQLSIYEQWLSYADKLKVQNVFLRLPIITDILEVQDTILPILEKYADKAKMNKKQWILMPEEHHAHTFSFVLKKCSNKFFKILYDPINYFKTKESNIAAYRILKSDVIFLIARDCNKNGEPSLLGYGATKILDVLKRFIRDKYTGYVVIDDSFNTLINYEKPKKILGFIPKRDKTKKRLEAIAYILYGDETKNVTESDILENQIKFIQEFFAKN